MSQTTNRATSYSTEQIAELFPDLMQITDTDLRDRVAAVWSEALTTGCGGKGWSFDELRAMKFTLLLDDDTMTYIAHLTSCVRQCLAIADVLGQVFGDAVPIHRDHLIAGALLADVGKLLEFDRDEAGNLIKSEYGASVRHPVSGAALAYKHGLPHEVQHIIATHSWEGEKVQRSIESIIFHHADFIDYDIARALAKRQAS